MNTVTGTTPESTNTYQRGDIFKRGGEYYILVQSDNTQYCMICLETGNRWYNATEYNGDGMSIPRDTVADMFGNDYSWKHIGPCNITVTPTK